MSDNNNLIPVPPGLEPAIRHMFDTCREECSTLDGWNLLKEQDGVKIYNKTTLKLIDGENHHAFKGVATIPRTAKTIRDAIEDITQREKWDPMALQSFVIEEVCKTSTLEAAFSYMSFKPPAPIISRRDFCCLAGIEENKDTGTYVLGSMSTMHPKCPPLNDFVRAELFGGYLLTPIGDGESTEVAYFAQVNPKGWIPTWLSNMVGVEQPMTLVRLKNAIVSGAITIADKPQ